MECKCHSRAEEGWLSGIEPAKEEGDGKEGEGRQVKPSHRLLIKTAILMPSAKKDEVTVVEIESEGYNKQKVSCLH